MQFRFTVINLAMLFSAGALVAIGCGDGGAGGLPTRTTGQDAYAANNDSHGSANTPGALNPVDNFGAVGPGNDLSPNTGSTGPGSVGTQGGGGTSSNPQGGGGTNSQGGGGKNQAGSNSQGGGGKNPGIDCNTICACPQFAEVKPQCEASCAAPPAGCAECVTAAKGDCEKIAACQACSGGSPEGGGGQAGQGQAGQGQAGEGQAGSESGGTNCAQLSACCETIMEMYKPTCDMGVATNNDAACGQYYTSLKSFCAN